MKIETKPISEAAEEYRERLYRNYLVNCRGVDLADAQRALRGSAPYVKRLIRRHVPTDRSIRILDLGCGFGNILYWLRQAGYTNLEGIDRSPAQVESARQLGLDFVLEGDISKHLANRPSSSVDLIFAFDVFEHFTKSEALRFADEVFRVLRPGGRFVLHVPNAEGSFAGSVSAGDFTHELILNRASVTQVLRCVGFSRIGTFEDTPVVHGVTSAARWFIWKMYRSMVSIAYAAETGELGRGLILTRNLLAVGQK